MTTRYIDPTAIDLTPAPEYVEILWDGFGTYCDHAVGQTILQKWQDAGISQRNLDVGLNKHVSKDGWHVSVHTGDTALKLLEWFSVQQGAAGIRWSNGLVPLARTIVEVDEKNLLDVSLTRL